MIVYILGTTQRYDKKIFLKALEATAIHRGSREQIIDKTGIIEKLSASEELIQMWEKYRKKFSYASEIQYADVMDVLIKMLPIVLFRNEGTSLIWLFMVSYKRSF